MGCGRCGQEQGRCGLGAVHKVSRGKVVDYGVSNQAGDRVDYIKKKKLKLGNTKK